MAQAAAWASVTVSVLAQVKRGSKTSYHQLADGVPVSCVIVKLHTAAQPIMATITLRKFCSSHSVHPTESDERNFLSVIVVMMGRGAVW